MLRYFKVKTFVYTILIIAISFFLLGYSTKNDIVVEIATVKKRLPTLLIMNISLTTNSEQMLRVPKKETIVFGYKDDDYADCFFEVIEISDSSEKEVIPTADYQHVNIRTKDKFLYLKKGMSVQYTFNLTNFYSFDVNKKYKIRLVFKVSKNNSVDDVYSDWLSIPRSL